MKDEPIFYVGLDVHQSTTVACVRDEQGGVRMRARGADRGEDDRAVGRQRRPAGACGLRGGDAGVRGCTTY